MYVVCEWIGNSQAVAHKHYLQMTDEHYQQAVAEPAAEAQQKAQQSGAESGRADSQAKRPTPVVADEYEPLRQCTNV
jgi:hypothetical protein